MGGLIVPRKYAVIPWFTRLFVEGLLSVRKLIEMWNLFKFNSFISSLLLVKVPNSGSTLDLQ
jgi:hypothetical protein